MSSSSGGGAKKAPGGRKNAAPAPLSALRPEDVAVRPRPSINAFGTKRPFSKTLPGSASPSSASSTTAGPSASLTLKRSRLDFTTGTGGTSASSSSMAGAAASSSSSLGTSQAGNSGPPPLKPPLEEPIKSFCASTEIEFDTFAETLYTSAENGKFNKVARFICAFIRDVLEKRTETGRLSLEAHITSTIAVVVKQHACKLTNVSLTRTLLSLACTSRGASPEKQAFLLSLVSTIAEAVPAAEPSIFIAYLHDVLGDANWAHKPATLPFSSRVLRSIGTRFPTRDLYQECGNDLPVPEQLLDNNLAPFVFDESDGNFKETTLLYLRRWWDSHVETPRGLIRAMAVFSALPEVRYRAARDIDMWLQNAKFQRVSLELLLYLGCNLEPLTGPESDREALAMLLAIRSYKSKQVAAAFTVMLRELMRRNSAHLPIVIGFLLKNEFGPKDQRSLYNMAIIQTLFQWDNKETTKVLAAELCNPLERNEDMAKSTRFFLRELVRSFLRADFAFATFADAYLAQVARLLAARSTRIQAHLGREAVGMCLLLPIIGIAQPIRDAFHSRRSSSASTVTTEIISRFQTDIHEYMEAVLLRLPQISLAFIHDKKEYVNSFYRLLFVESLESYTSLELGPNDGEWQQAHRIINECGISEKMIMLIAEAKDLPGADKLSLLDMVVKAAILCRPTSDAERPVVELTSCKTVDNLLRVAELSSGGVKIVDEEGEEGAEGSRSENTGSTVEGSSGGPEAKRRKAWNTVEERRGALGSLAIREHVWRAWLILVNICCSGGPPALFGEIYGRYPTLRMLVRMILTNTFSFPASTDGISAEEMSAVDAELSEAEVLRLTGAVERQLMEATRLPASEIPNVFCYSNPTGPPRCPPSAPLHELRQFSLDRGFSARLCQLRSPDLLSQLIAERGAASAMPAIEELLHSQSEAASFVPLECLCQFLIHHLTMDPSKRRVQEDKIGQITCRLRSIVVSTDAAAEAESTTMVLFLLGHLSGAEDASEKEAAAALLLSLFNQDESDGVSSTKVSLLCLVNFKHFEKIRSRACSLVASACAVEGDAARLAGYIQFLTVHADPAALHTVAYELSRSPCRSDTNIQNFMVDFFAKYIESASSEGVADEKEHNLEMLNVRIEGREIRVVSSALYGLLELLSRFAGGGEARKRLLSAILDTQGRLPSVVNAEGEPVILLTEKIRRVMLSSTDEQIVKLALENVDGETALRLICTFGLTPFSASQLLANLDESADQVKFLEDASRARGYVIAYQTRGATGGQKFYEAISSLLASNMEIVKEEGHEPLYMAPPPTFSSSTSTTSVIANPATPIILSKTELLKRLKQLVATGSFKLHPDDFRSAAASEATIDACLEFLEAHLKFFLGNMSALNEMFLLLNSTAEKFPLVPGKLRALCGKVLKSASVTPSVEEQLKTYTAPSALDAAKKIDPYKKASPDEILNMILNQKGNQSSAVRARLINLYLLKRPEIIDMKAPSADVDRQIAKIFGGEKRNGLEGLVGQMWLQSRPDTIRAVIARLLKEYQPAIRSAAVIELLSHCQRSPTFFKSLTKSELTTAAAYMVERATECASGAEGSQSEGEGKADDVIRQIGDFAEKMVDLLGTVILAELANHCLLVAQSVTDRSRRLAAENLLAELKDRFPFLRVTSSSTRVSFEGPQERRAVMDNRANRLVLTMFESESDSDVGNAVDALRQMLYKKPEIVARQLPIMSRLLERIIDCPSRQVRDTLRFHWVVAFLLHTCEKLVDVLAEGQLTHLDEAIVALTEFYQAHAAGTKDDRDFSFRLLSLIRLYLQKRAPQAKAFLCSDAAPEGITEMALKHGNGFSDIQKACTED